MKKKMLFSFAVSASICVITSLQAIPRIQLNSSVLKIVDGSDFINIKNIFGYGKNIKTIIEGTQSLNVATQLAEAYQFDLPFPLVEGNKNTTRIALVRYGDEYLTTREIEELEITGTGNPELLQNALIHATSHFEKISSDYIEEIQVGKMYMIKLIEDWSTLRNRPDTILLNWSKIDHSEQESLYQSIKDFKTLNRFFNDLLLFLADLIQNCPKSHKAYRDSLVL